MKAISIHIGLNKIDPKHYGDDGALAGCHNDAKALFGLAKSQKFTAGKPMLDGAATADRVIQAISAAARKLQSGDSLLLTYSGHGSDVKDIEGGDESDGPDETWCLYDRMLLDDELWALWAQFKPGVRITVLSDSCHSGSVTRAAFAPPGAARIPKRRRTRLLPEQLRKTATTDWAAVYRAIQLRTRGEAQQAVKASVILISGCQDDQESADGDDYGYFTGTLLKVWNKGTFDQSCRVLRARVLSRMADADQRPSYSLIGAPNPDFEAAPALRPAPTGSKAKATKPAPKSRGATRSGRARTMRETPLAWVLRELEINGLRNPKPDAQIGKFFAEMEKIDQRNHWPSRTEVFRELVLANFPRTRLSFADLINGRYDTPTRLAAIMG